MAGLDARRVVVGAARSLGGHQALRYTVSQARERGATLVVVRAYGGAAPREPVWRTTLAETAVAEVNEVFVEALGAMPKDLSIQVVVREGRAGPVLVAVADHDSDLLVIGGSGTHRLTYMRTATVARYCALHAGCPVMIAPLPAMARTPRVGRLARAVAFAAEETLRACDSTGTTSPPQPS